jgi:hypothetical protein
MVYLSLKAELNVQNGHCPLSGSHVLSIARLAKITQPNKKGHNFFPRARRTILYRFFAADYDPVLEFFPARQDFEIIGLLSVKNDLHCNI